MPYTITLRVKTFSGKPIMSEKPFRILQDERILCLYISAILTQILFCFNAGDFFYAQSGRRFAENE